MAKHIEIVALETDDLTRFSHLFYNELLLELPIDALMLGAIDTSEDIPKAVGLLMFHVREQSAYIDWLFVDEESRRIGVATALMDELKRLCSQTDAGEIETIFMNFTEVISGMGRFLKNNDFAVTFFDGNYCIYAPLKKVKLMSESKPRVTNLKALPLSEVSENSYKVFDKYLDVVNDAYIGILTPLDKDSYREESRIIVDGDRIVGLMLVGDTIDKDNIIIDWVYSIPKYILGVVPLAFDTVITELRKNVSENAMLSMASLSDNVGIIIRKSMPGAVFLESYSAFWIVER